MTAQTQTTEWETLEPAGVWRYFAGMAAVPRPSKKEERIRAHVRKLALDQGWGIREDGVGNMVVEVPASPGYEQAPVTVLQGHLDMVCEKNSGTRHDFDNDPIKLIVDTDTDAEGEQIVRADGTTLGADNGIGLAMAFAAATDPAVKHGPLEILCTIDEEAGMTGAKVLTPDFFSGRRLLNLDSEEDDVIYIGCAGGCDTTLAWSLATAAAGPEVEACRVKVAGLRGGHSGGDIHLNRANAITVLVQVLGAIESAGPRLVDLTGGSLRNAIPREASVVVIGSSGLADAVRKAAADIQAEVVRVNDEAECAISVEPAEAAAALSAQDTQRVLAALTALPHGPVAVVPEIAGLVQTSNNVATVRTEHGAAGKLQITVGCLSRSSVREELHATARQIRAVAELAGATSETGNEYPGWRPNLDSPTLATCRRLYRELFNEQPNVTAIHAGLECGLIGERIGDDIDMVSFGPRIEGAHSPDERVYVKSVQKSWKYLTAVLAELAKA